MPRLSVVTVDGFALHILFKDVVCTSASARAIRGGVNAIYRVLHQLVRILVTLSLLVLSENVDASRIKTLRPSGEGIT